MSFENLLKRIEAGKGELEEFTIPCINEKVNLKKLTKGELKKAQEWATENYLTNRKRSEATTTAIICMSIVGSDIFPLSKETHDFLTGDDIPVEMVHALASKVLKLNGMEDLLNNVRNV